MNDQVKRWTAIGDFILHGGDAKAECFSNDIASRLAACADLLRGVEDLSAVAVMRWADVEKVREAIRSAMHFAQCKHDSAQWFGMKEAIDLLPKPARSETKGVQS